MNTHVDSSGGLLKSVWLIVAAVLMGLVVMGGCAHDRDDHHRDHDHDWDHDHHHHHDRDYDDHHH